MLSNQYKLINYNDSYKEFIYQVKKEAYKKYVEEYWGVWIEEDQRNYFESFLKQYKEDIFIIQVNNEDIGFYNGENLEDGSYEIGNICIIPKYQGKGIGTQILKDVMKEHEHQVLHIQYFKSNKAGNLYKRLGFVPDGETQFHYRMIKKI